MESFWLDLESQLKIRDSESSSGLGGEDPDRIHVELSKSRDKKYSRKFLPENFYTNFLTKIPAQFPMTPEFLRYSNFLFKK